MYYHFPPNGPVEKINDQEATNRMKALSNQWENENIAHGKLVMGVHDWAFTDSTVDIPNLRTGGTVPINQTVTAIDNGDLYGDCFLKPKESQIQNIDNLIINAGHAIQDNSN
ncbi:MAG: hypothetical protein JWO32_1311 [Bacteroidetes bacterium]|nr:hypothetical protein [Bacteroidota bacterium]